MTKTRCKFVCTKRDEQPDGSRHFHFSAVVKGTDPDAENSQFFKYTPSGTLYFGCVNPAVDFEEGKEYFVDLSPAPVAAEVAAE